MKVSSTMMKVFHICDEKCFIKRGNLIKTPSMMCRHIIERVHRIMSIKHQFQLQAKALVAC